MAKARSDSNSYVASLSRNSRIPTLCVSMGAPYVPLRTQVYRCASAPVQWPVPFIHFETAAIASVTTPKKLAKIPRYPNHIAVVVTAWALPRPPKIDSPACLVNAPVDDESDHRSTDDNECHCKGNPEVHLFPYVMSSVSKMGVMVRFLGTPWTELRRSSTTSSSWRVVSMTADMLRSSSGSGTRSTRAMAWHWAT